jgi:hypothetical protein
MLNPKADGRCQYTQHDVILQVVLRSTRRGAPGFMRAGDAWRPELGIWLLAVGTCCCWYLLQEPQDYSRDTVET